MGKTNSCGQFIKSVPSYVQPFLKICIFSKKILMKTEIHKLFQSNDIAEAFVQWSQDKWQSPRLSTPFKNSGHNFQFLERPKLKDKKHLR